MSYYLSYEEKQKIISRRKSEGMKRYKYTMLFFDDSKVMSYNTICGYVNWKAKVLALYDDAFSFSVTTKRQLKSFAKTYNLAIKLKERI